MRTRSKILALLILALSTQPLPAWAKLNVLTSTTDLAAIAREVGGSEVNVESIAKGSQDPHFIEAKPSYMLKVSKADLLVTIGMELEIGWIPSLVQGARNPKVNQGQKGYLEVGPGVHPLEVPQGKVTRAEGDVHPDGNPHVTLDPIRAGEIAVLIGDRLSQLDGSHSADYSRNAKAFQARMKAKTAEWKARIEKSGVKRVVSYHKTLTYFFDRFGIQNPVILEPKPGIPPTSGHILEVIRIMKEQKIPLIMVENFFDSSVTKKVIAELPQVRSVNVPVAVGGEEGIRAMDDLYEALVKAVEGK